MMDHPKEWGGARWLLYLAIDRTDEGVMTYHCDRFNVAASITTKKSPPSVKRIFYFRDEPDVEY